jgi:hypothetical protein
MTDRIGRQPIQENFARRVEKFPHVIGHADRFRQYEVPAMVCRLHDHVGQPEFAVWRNVWLKSEPMLRVRRKRVWL